MKRPVVIVDYDPRWPLWYEEERARLLPAIGHKIVALEHIGSTAVPGLGAKPIIDMLAGVRERADADECLPLLAPLGYTDVTPQDDPQWYYCLGRHEEADQFHLHLVQYPSIHWERHLLFRDFIRTRPDLVQQYDQLKRELAACYGSDRTGYTEAKTEFIESVVAQARAASAAAAERGEDVIASKKERGNEHVERVQGFRHAGERARFGGSGHHRRGVRQDHHLAGE